MEQFKRKALAIAFMAAVGTADTGGGESSKLSKEQIAAMSDGKAWADKLHEAGISHAQTENNLYLHIIQELASLAEVLAFGLGFGNEAERLETTGSLVDRSEAKQLGQLVSKIKRIGYSIYGMPVKGDDDVVSTFWGNPMEGTQGIKGKAAVLKLFKADGDVRDKVGSLNTFTNRGRPKKNTKGELPIQRRVNAAADVPSMGDAATLVKIMGIPGEMKGKKISMDKRESIAIAAMVASIKATEERNVPILLHAVINRCRVSADKDLQKFALESLPLMEKIENASDASTKTANRRKLVKGDKKETAK